MLKLFFYVSALLSIPIAYFLPTISVEHIAYFLRTLSVKKIAYFLLTFPDEEYIDPDLSAHLWIYIGCSLCVILFIFSPYAPQSTEVPILHRILFSLLNLFRVAIACHPQPRVDLLMTDWISIIGPVWVSSTVSKVIVVFLSMYVVKICSDFPYGLWSLLVIPVDIRCFIQLLKTLQYDGEIFEFFYSVAVCIAWGKGKWSIVLCCILLLAVHNWWEVVTADT